MTARGAGLDWILLMNVELITRYVKLLICFGIVWAGIWLWNTNGCRKVAGAEMEPSIKKEKWVWTNPTVRQPESLSRGDVIFFRHVSMLRRQEAEFIARVVGLPGDRIGIVKGEVRINGEEYKDGLQPAQRGAEDYEEIVVPRDTVFVLCDNRRAARGCDSRTIGPVARWAILGKAK